MLLNPYETRELHFIRQWPLCSWIGEVTFKTFERLTREAFQKKV
jgi:hypothetical protein